MNIDVDKRKFTLYRYTDEANLCVAVPINYLPFIEQAISEYGVLQSVPADRTVRGIFITNADDLVFDPDAPQSDITINRLNPV